MYELNDDFHAEAKRKGLVAVLPEANELFIDIDDADSLRQFEAMYEVLEQRYSLEVTHREPSPSGAPSHVHIYVSVYASTGCGWKHGDPVELTSHQRIAMQTLLGSDLIREALSLLRLIDSVRAPTVFFEKPDHPRARSAS